MPRYVFSLDSKRFNEEAHSALGKVGKKLIDDIPEIDGIGFVITYAEDVGDPKPAAFAVSRSNDPRVVCRAALQTMKLLQGQVDHLGQQAQALLDVMPQEADGQKQETHDQDRCTQEEDAASGDPGTGGPPEASED